MDTKEQLEQIKAEIIDEARAITSTEEEAQALAAIRAILIHASK